MQFPKEPDCGAAEFIKQRQQYPLSTFYLLQTKQWKPQFYNEAWGNEASALTRAGGKELSVPDSLRTDQKKKKKRRPFHLLFSPLAFQK